MKIYAFIIGLLFTTIALNGMEKNPYLNNDSLINNTTSQKNLSERNNDSPARISTLKVGLGCAAAGGIFSLACILHAQDGGPTPDSAYLVPRILLGAIATGITGAVLFRGYNRAEQWRRKRELGELKQYTRQLPTEE